MKTIPININLRFADGYIEYLRTKLQSLNWLQFSFPAVQVGKNQQNNKMYPEISLRNGTKESQIIIPDNSVNSFCFFEKNTCIPDQILNTYNLSLLFWLDLQKCNIETDTAVKEVIIILQRNNCSNIIVDYDDIFRKYGIDYSQNQFFMYPFSKFRINFKAVSGEICF